MVFVSGKHCYALEDHIANNGISNVAVVRVEQLCPFPAKMLQDVVARYPNANCETVSRDTLGDQSNIRDFSYSLHLEPGGAPQPGRVELLRAQIPQPGRRQPGLQGPARVLPAGHRNRQRAQERGQGDSGERVRVIHQLWLSRASVKFNLLGEANHNRRWLHDSESIIY